MTDLYKNALDALPDAVFLADAEFRVVYHNRLFHELFRPEKSGLRLGDAISCGDKCGECGEGEKCSLCGLRSAIRRAAASPFGSYRGNVRKTMRASGSVMPVSFDLTVSRVGDLYLGCLGDLRGGELDADLAGAERFQRGLLPDRSADVGAAFDYLYLPIRRVGGDMLDVYRRGACACGLVADVSGKGVTAAMLSSFIKATFRRDLPPARALTFMQSAYRSLKTDERSYITALAVEIDRAAGRAEFCSAGHNVPLLRKSGGKVTAHYAPAPPVSGWFDEVEYRTSSVEARPGDLFVLATDGVTEHVGAEGERFSLARLERALARAHSPAGFLAGLSSSLRDFAGEQGDDLTVLAIQV